MVSIREQAQRDVARQHGFENVTENFSWGPDLSLRMTCKQCGKRYYYNQTLRMISHELDVHNSINGESV